MSKTVSPPGTTCSQAGRKRRLTFCRKTIETTANKTAAPSLDERVTLPGEALEHEAFPPEESRHHLRELRLKAPRGRTRETSEREHRSMKNTSMCTYFYERTHRSTYMTKVGICSVVISSQSMERKKT